MDNKRDQVIKLFLKNLLLSITVKWIKTLEINERFIFQTIKLFKNPSTWKNHHRGGSTRAKVVVQCVFEEIHKNPVHLGCQIKQIQIL